MELGGVDYFKFLFAMLFVLGLIAALAIAGKKFGLGHRGPVKRGNGRRLRIVEAMPLDAKRRVVLIQRDDREHLILLGSSTEEIIEAGIEPGTSSPSNPAVPVRSAPVLSLEVGSKG